MTTPLTAVFRPLDLDPIASAEGRVAVLLTEDAKLDSGARRVNRLSKGALVRFAASKTFAKMETGTVHVLSYPAGMAAEAVLVVKLGRRPAMQTARRAGAALARAMGEGALLVLAGTTVRPEEIAFGLALAAYRFTDHKTDADAAPAARDVSFMVSKPDLARAAAASLDALAEGVFFTRNLVNEPANILTTLDFSKRLADLSEIGLNVEILDEDKLAALGMGALLSVGQGSDSPTRVVVMQWRGGGEDAAPLALVGKGVVFDTGGISIKPAAGMEDMTMDMGGAATVAGVMRTLALRKAKANVVGLVGIVENMPGGRATRPGDVVTSMKGDTIEVINTDAEGRLVLADVLSYTQQRFSPAAIIDLATLTGAIIVGLGHEKTGVFSNNDTFCNALLGAAAAEGEGAWRMPLDPAYDKLLKSRIADVKNVGGRVAGSITAAQFLQRFVNAGTAWIHLDIAGTALVKEATALAPKGATGWGVRTLDRLVRTRFED